MWFGKNSFMLLMGASLLSFGLERGVEGYLPYKKKIAMILPVCVRISYKQEQVGFSFYTASKPPTPSGGWIFGVVLGGTWGRQNLDRIFKKNRVGFGRTDLSLRLS